MKEFYDLKIPSYEKDTDPLLKVFIGYDPRQPVAYHVLAHSIWKRASYPTPVTQLNLTQLPIKRRGLTEFTYSRFLTPWVSGFKGISLFIDSDFLCLWDIYDLLAYTVGYPEFGVFVVPGKLRFEWPSLMLFNNANCKVLTPEFVENTDNKLFDFTWTGEVGKLSPSWNHLVGYDTPNPSAAMVHFTQGVPCWPETKDCEYSAEWWKEFRELKSSVSFDDLMGNSVHAKPVLDRLART